MPKIYEYVNANTIAAYIATQAGSNKIAYLGPALFPAKKKLGLDLKWIKSHAGLPVTLAIGAFDAKAPIRGRSGFEVLKTEMPFFREAINIGEQDRQEFLKVMESGDQYVKAILNKIFDDSANLVASADVVNERMRMQLLSTGKIVLADKEGRSLSYDYDFKAANKTTLTGNNMWSNPDAPINAQIEEWKNDIMSATGEELRRAVCTRKTLNYLKKNNEILAELKPLAAAQAAPIRDANIIEWFKSAHNISVYTYDKMYTMTVGGTGVKYFPDDVFTLLPEGNLGNTWYGTTPEEADLMSSQAANVKILNTGVALTTYEEVNPVNVVTQVSEIALPSFERADQVFIATVHTA